MKVALDIRQRAWTQLRHHAHQLIAEGYSRMKPSEFEKWKEPDITGELCRHIQDFLESFAAPPWMTRYAVRDDPKLNVPGKYGESRPRIDIEFEMISRGLRPKFRFEAKRLGPQHPVGKYLGSEGMGAFLDGYYPLTHPEAGMLAYVQSHDYPYWSNKVGIALSKDVPVFKLEATQPYFPEQKIVQSLATHRTKHLVANGELLIWHTFLLFR